MAQNVAGMERIGLDGGAALAAGGTKVVETFEVSALALPVADGIIDKFELANAAEIGNGKNRAEDRLQTGVIALIGQQVHLEKLLVGLLLDLDEVRNGDRRLDLGKIDSLGRGF
nr:hypothetical protein [Nevskia soli]